MPGEDKNTEDILARFLRIFPSIPIEERKQVVVIIEDQPISWNLAYNEIKHKTNLGVKIAKKLVELSII